MKVIVICFVLVLSNGFSSFLFASNETNIESSNVEDIDNFSKAVVAVREKNYALAADLFYPLAEAGDVDAQFNLSILIRNGLGRPQNFSKALFWAWLSFSGGLEKANAVVEVIIELVPENAHDAIREQVYDFLLEKVNEGNRASLMQLGKYFLEILPNPDYNKSYLCYSIASAFGEKGSKVLRDQVLESVENEKIVEIQDRASVMFETLRRGDKINSLEK